MKKEIICYVSELPLGSILKEDMFTENGALLCTKETVLDDNILNSLKKYHGKVKTTLEIPNEEEHKNEILAEKDSSLNFSNSFKFYAKESLINLYKNLNDTNNILEHAYNIGGQVCNFINGSKDLGINLSNLKISDEYTYKHSVDVGTIAALLAAKLDKNEDFIKDLTVAGVLHDIGKSKIPENILNKSGKLTDEEFKIMKLHPVLGYNLIKESKDIPNSVKNAVLNHHENIDGSGYPRGIKNNEIGELAKILSISDVFDALVTKRPYKEAKTPTQAIEMMYAMANKFDLHFFNIFLQTINAYPNGTEVLLSNGETGIVLKQNKSFPLRPIIQIKDTCKIVNLSIDMNYLSVIIIN